MSLGTLPRLVPFASWADLLAYLDGPGPADRQIRWVHYKAPMDSYARLVRVHARYRNGKLRIDPMSNEADSFTADPGHLDRFFRKETV